MGATESPTDPEEGDVSEKVTMIKEFHGTKNFGNRENLQRQQAKAADLYRSLTPEEIGELARFAIDSFEP
jgi:hypothetical protein